jgi:hypothetical protein
MEPTANNLGIFLFSTALCTRNPPPEEELDSDYAWPESYLNPKNRIDSLSKLRTQRWTIDGSSTIGTRFFAFPEFARGRPPLRIDTFIPDTNQQPGYLRDTLHPNASMFVENRHVGDTSIAQHILRALEAWSERWGWDEFEEAYLNMPFGSRILIKNIDISPREMVIDLVPYYAVEQQMLSIEALQDLWNLPPGSWPEILDIQELRFVKQLHESISLVQLPRDDHQSYVFKSLTDDLKPFYHELKTLLTLAYHPNIISRPSHVITKRCGFGGKTGVCGFILEYHSQGTLRSVLSQHAIHHHPVFSDQLRWAIQITSAILHIHESSSGNIFYTTMKPENIAMASSPSNPTVLDAVLIDFEQRLGPRCWNPPEINYIDYLTTLATKASVISMKQKYAALLESANLLYPETESKTSTMAKYKNPKYGYSHPWPTLSVAQREAAQVFGLGKLLWCIFENGTLLNTAVGIHTFRECVSDVEFPEFRRAPEAVRDLIRRCTMGDGEWRGRGLPLVRRGAKIGVRGGSGEETEEDVRVACRKWWREEVADGEKFVGARARRTLDDADVWSWAAERPSLREVLRELESLIGT